LDQPAAALEIWKFEIEKGEYSAEVTLTDLVSNLKARKVLNIDLGKFDYPMLISGIVFTLGEDTGDKIVKDKFTRNGHLVIPSVSRDFDSGRDLPGYYYEIYPTRNTPDILMITNNIYDANGKAIASEDTSRIVIERSGRALSISENLELNQLAPGKYELALDIWDSNFKNKLDSRSAKFAIDWSLKSLIEKDFETAVEQLRYFATPEERNALKKTDEQFRYQAIADFWKRHDPTPSTPQNELREEYYSRVRYANTNFSNFGRPGYLTDFGKVYITYGKPDEIERHPFDPNSKAYEIWYYYKHHIKFVFIDKNGYGYYELAYPFPEGIKM
jgi:GWxTD domain-containing protein